MKSLRTIKEVQRLIGCLDALGQFLSRLGDKCRYFFQTIKKKAMFEWIEEVEEAFVQLKNHLHTLPQLISPLKDEKLYMYLAISDHSLSVVLLAERDGHQILVYCFKRLQRQCPHHGIPVWLLIQTFYNGLTHEFRIYIDAASGGSLLTKNATEAKELIEKMAANDNYHPRGRQNVKKGGKLNVDALTMLASSVQALTSRFDKLQAETLTSPQEVCQMCNVQGHIAPDFPQNMSEMSIEQANSLYSSNPKNPYDPYSNSYNEGWKHHPNFSYKNTQAQQNPPPSPRPNNYNSPPGFQQRPPMNQQPTQLLPQKSSLELMMESFITTTNSAIQQQGSSIQQLQAQSKLMETQISQLSQQMSRLSTLHDQAKVQKEQCNAVFLRRDEPPPRQIDEKVCSVESRENERGEDVQGP
ncbi:uncharacterized protein LOC110704734 [Chenopodium quinoa]|uniref:uncharacterized protein LOC110704734 n=1 Tax=Chenopodium quinoa TaxID=63459 RepID=UPI000B76E34F|nr:uncharacterized protein LOC110704734 [Chenopodium quinoa]